MTDIFRYLGGFAVLLVILPFAAVATGAQLALVVYALDDVVVLSKLLYYIGLIALIISIIAYIVKDVKTTKFGFSFSLIFSSIGIMILDYDMIATDEMKAYYILATLMFLLMGVIMFYMFYKEDALAERTMNMFWLLTWIFYILAILFQAAYVQGDISDVRGSHLMESNVFLPQTMLLGGAMGIYFAILFVVKYLLKMQKFGRENIYKIIDLLLVFTWLLGLTYCVFVTLPQLYINGYVPSGVLGVLSNYILAIVMIQVTLMAVSVSPTIFYAILLIMLILHVIYEYAIK